MKLLEQTSNIQNSLGIYCRTGEEQEIPGITENRIHHYRRLVFNVVKNTMMQAYPLTLQVLGEEKFTTLVHDFFKNHDPGTPQVWKLPGEFFEYAVEADFLSQTGLKWLNDMLLFEWIEIEVHTMPDQEIDEFSRKGDFLNDLLITNPESRLIQLKYPVHLMKVKEAEKSPGNYFVLISRNPDSGHVNFFNLSLVHAWLYERIVTENRPVKDFLTEIETTFGIENNLVLKENLEKLISDLISGQAIMGFAKDNNK